MTVHDNISGVCCTKGHHVYKDIRIPFLGETLASQGEEDNP